MGLFGKSKKERETEYMSRLDVPSCLKEDLLMMHLQLWGLEQLPQETY